MSSTVKQKGSDMEPETEAPATCWSVGANEHELLGEGWHDRSTDGRCGIEMRVSFPDGAKLNPPDLPSRGTLGFLINSPVTQLGGLVRVEARLTALLPEGMDEADRAEYPDDRCQYLYTRWLLHNDLYQWRELSWDFPYPLLQPEITLATTPGFVPNDHLQNGDYRPMGTALAAVRLI